MERRGVVLASEGRAGGEREGKGGEAAAVAGDRLTVEHILRVWD